ncbi:MAG TPA: hypothetical protein VG389_07515 [Myxococcota bacterium]|nr:hypothetical protein [Myxococcota bacterium]
MGTIGNTADTLLLSLELLGAEEVESVDDPVTTLAEVAVRHLDASGSARELFRVATSLTADEVAQLAAELEGFAAGEQPVLRFAPQEPDLELEVRRESELMLLEARIDLGAISEVMRDDGMGRNQMSVRFTTDGPRLRAFAEGLRRELLVACRGRLAS